MNYTLLASLARIASGESADVTQQRDGQGIGTFVVDVTAISGAGASVVATIEALDATSGKYYALLASAAITTVSTVVLRVGPGFPVTANLSANDAMPKQFRVKFVIAGTTPSVTFSVGATVL